MCGGWGVGAAAGRARVFTRPKITLRDLYTSLRDAADGPGGHVGQHDRSAAQEHEKYVPARAKQARKSTRTPQPGPAATQGVSRDRSARRAAALSSCPRRIVVEGQLVCSCSELSCRIQIDMNTQQVSRSSLNALEPEHTCWSNQIKRDGSR